MDIQQATDELQASRRTVRFFESLVRASVDGIVITDSSQNIIEVNDAFCSFFDRKRHEILETNIFIWLGQMDSKANARWARIERCVRSGKASCRDVEFWIGEELDRVFSVNASMVEAEPGEEPGVIISIWRDISKRKRAQRGLQKARDELQQRVEERTRELKSVNEQLQKDITKRKRVEEILRLKDSRIEALWKLSQMKEASFDEVAAFVLENAVELTKSNLGFWGWVNKDESVFTVQASRTAIKECGVLKKNIQYKMEKTGIWGEAARQRKPIINNDFQAPNLAPKSLFNDQTDIKRFISIPVFERNRIVSLVAVANKKKNYDESDVRQLKLLMNSVCQLILRRQSEEELEAERKRLFSLLSELPGFVYLQAPDYSIKFANRLFRDLFGSPDGKPCYETMQNRKTPCEVCPTLKVFDSNTPQEWEWVGPGGQTFQIFDYPFTDIDGSPLVLELGIDISGRKEMERELLQAKSEAEKANLIKDKFVSLVSHDLRGPLSTQIGFLKFMEKYNPAPEKALDMLSKAISSGEQMFRLIEGLLSLSRLKRGKIEPQSAFLDAGQLVRQAMIDFEKIAQEKGVRLTSQVPEKTIVYADKILLYEVIKNLVSNAIKFCKKGDSVSVFLPQDATTTIAVSDTGVGIDPKMLDSIFDYEVKTTTIGTNGESGTGFGLPLSKEILEAHKGTISTELNKGGGSTFYVALPKVRPLILLAPHEKTDRFLARQVLEMLDVDIIEAESEEQALEILKGDLPHLIIMDLMALAGYGGKLIELTGRDPATEPIPIIALTTGDDEETNEEAKRLGVNNLMDRASLLDDFIPMVKSLLGEI